MNIINLAIIAAICLVCWGMNSRFYHNTANKELNDFWYVIGAVIARIMGPVATIIWLGQFLSDYIIWKKDEHLAHEG